MFVGFVLIKIKILRGLDTFSLESGPYKPVCSHIRFV
jgi:hypothetical protein